MYKRFHCLNCGLKFKRVYNRRQHEKNVKCEKKENYNDPEILVRIDKLEKELNESKEKIINLEKEIKQIKRNRRRCKTESKNIKQRKIEEYGF